MNVIESQKKLNPDNKIIKLIGKRVIAKNGDSVGRVKDFLYNKDKITGILIKGNKGKFALDYSYILEIADSVMLKIDPIFRLIGMEVFDGDGRKLGKVKNLDRVGNSNNFNALIVKSNILKKSISIPKKEIETSENNVILNMIYEK